MADVLSLLRLLPSFIVVSFVKPGRAYEVKDLKPDIHPKVNMIEVRCACGATYQVLSARKEMKLDLCSDCHPFFTGRRNIIDVTGRVEKFERRAALAAKTAKAK